MQVTEQVRDRMRTGRKMIKAGTEEEEGKRVEGKDRAAGQGPRDKTSTEGTEQQRESRRVREKGGRWRRTTVNNRKRGRPRKEHGAKKTEDRNGSEREDKAIAPCHALRER
ncbi:hypothetical protein NQZ68_017628 [Dissostichus eleginoides]|nr:hypothetical protein NQZ68_017628 [Dissostichus eleginoides]